MFTMMMSLDEEGEDDTHLPDQMAECFHINTYTTRGGGDKGPSEVHLARFGTSFRQSDGDHVLLCWCLCACTLYVSY